MLNRTLQPPLCTPQQMNILRPQIARLPNGATLHWLPADDHEVVRIDLLIEGGRWHQQHPLQALFTNRMLREGTRFYTSAQIASRLDYYGAWLELSCTMLHSCITLYSLSKYLPQTLELLGSMLTEPSFPEAELQVVTETNLQQFQVNLSKVSFLAHRGLMQMLYGPQHPCGRMVEERDYRHIHVELLRDFYRQCYHPSRMHIFLFGKIGDDELRMVTEGLGTCSFGNEIPIPLPPTDFVIQPAAEQRTFTERAEAMQSAVRMGLLTIDNHHPDFQKLRLLVTLLGGYFGSRLMSNIREEKGYTYGIGAELATHPGCSLLHIHTETANEYVPALITEVYHEIDRLQNELVSEEELSMVKNYKLGEMCREMESVFSLADAWIFVQTHGLADNYFSTVLDDVKHTTPQEIRDLAVRYLCKEKLKESVSGKKIS